MTARALKEVSWFDFRAAAWWLGLLYRRPKRFRGALEELPRMRMLRAGVILMIHALIYAIFIAAVGRLLACASLGASLTESARAASPVIMAHAKQLAAGITTGIKTALPVWLVAWIMAGIRNSWRPGSIEGKVVIAHSALGFGLIACIFIIFSGIAFGVAFGITGGVGLGIAIGVALGITFAIATGTCVEFLSGSITEISDNVSISITMAVFVGSYLGAFVALILGYTEKYGVWVAPEIADRTNLWIAIGS